jgi:DNA replication protein DnaC
VNTVICSDEDRELERLNSLLLGRRSGSKAHSSESINSIEDAMKMANKMAEIAKSMPKEPERPKINPVPRINTMFPKLFVNSTFDNYENTHESHKILKIKLEESARQINSAILVGATGTGKTHLAIAYSRILMTCMFDESGKIPTFIPITIIELLSSVLEKTRTMDDYKKVDVLLLDDLGREKKGDWSDVKIFELINYRYLQMLPTIITTNFKSEELSPRIEQVNVSRIQQMCKPFAVQGDDYRKGYKVKQAVISSI